MKDHQFAMIMIWLSIIAMAVVTSVPVKICAGIIGLVYTISLIVEIVSDLFGARRRAGP